MSPGFPRRFKPSFGRGTGTSQSGPYSDTASSTSFGSCTPTTAGSSRGRHFRETRTSTLRTESRDDARQPFAESYATNSLGSDLEAGYDAWNSWNSGWRRKCRRCSFARIRDVLIGSALDRKIWNPTNCREIGYRIRDGDSISRFAVRWLGFVILSALISTFHTRMGLSCGVVYSHPSDTPGVDSSGIDDPSSRGRQIPSRWLLFAQIFVGVSSCFILAQGIVGLRAARERVECVRQTANTMAYSLLKTAKPNPGYGLNWRQLQVIIYECLALTVAYPVALLHEIKQNAWEPDISRICREAAQALQMLREGTHDGRPFDGESSEIPDFAPVEYFFEIFSIQLEKEYRTQLKRSKIPSMTTHHIIYNIRSHFENLVDQGNLDERRAPIIRENIDMMAFSGRECFIFSFRDVAPLVLLRLLDVCMRVMALTLPAQNCDWIINSTRDTHGRIMMPRLTTIVAICGLSAASAILLMLLNEIWQMWDPFRHGFNNFAWTLGLAREVDAMLNEYDEREEASRIRRHAYMIEIPSSESSCSSRVNDHVRMMTL